MIRDETTYNSSCPGFDGPNQSRLRIITIPSSHTAQLSQQQRRKRRRTKKIIIIHIVRPNRIQRPREAEKKNLKPNLRRGERCGSRPKLIPHRLRYYSRRNCFSSAGWGGSENTCTLGERKPHYSLMSFNFPPLQFPFEPVVVLQC